MSSQLSWQYNEFKQIGKDYSLPAEVDVYDESHANFRDLEKESNEVLDALAVQAGDVIIDFGAGTGTFAIQASRRGAKVYAVDVSTAMLDYAKAKAAEAGVSTIEFRHSGFLNYDHPAEAVDVITTTFAFHHLPDFWKGVALERIHRLLKPGGQLYIRDVIINDEDALTAISAFIEKQAAAGGDFLRDDAEGHFREEFSTYEWVMDELLTRAGFTIKEKSMHEGLIGTYYCVKNGSSN